MFKKTFLFITTLFTAISVSTGYGAPDSLKGSVNASTFLDWFKNADKYVHTNGLIFLDLIPIIFLVVQAYLFFKDHNKLKGLFTVFAILANLIGVFLVIEYANPIASQMSGWTLEKLPSDWISQKDDWLKYIGLYGLMGILGWLFFVITYFVPAKNTAVKRLPGFLNFSKNGILFFLTFILGMSMSRLYDFFLFPFQYEISGATFIEMHRPLDIAIRKAGPIVFTFILTLHLLLISLLFVEKSKSKALLIIAAVVFLLCDTFIALQCNGPINDLFLTWTPKSVPVNWAIIRDEWLSYHVYRDIFMILGFSSILLTHFIEKNKVQ